MGHRNATTTFAGILLIAVICGAAWQDAPVKWPAAEEPGAQRITHQFDEAGATISATVSNVVMWPEGNLTRYISLSVSRGGPDANAPDYVRMTNMANVDISKAHPVGGGLGAAKVTVKPARNLTWAAVASWRDLTFDAKLD